LPTPTKVAGYDSVPPFVCVSVFPHDISKTDAPRITKLDKERSKMSPGNTFILGSKDQRSRGHESQKHCRRGICTLV